ncbi:hypothetical protein AMAG_19432 [Allomyces macrogynus ATCC 38327]|uniref:Uncharacterized protein n=1 Tax=Allomyces macrogynus (strain ATCC 38327) TaxID=578462 RepID=A0A0L0SRW5_ALLM3|nr:hypothetical protein AMAG_19432 [Allomyces macrogynus ATCC 38327]|eukprot:KNE65110.1 hypothetical protein AMAG_19432 [Allomyces macrogynus ATCC 38327]
MTRSKARIYALLVIFVTLAVFPAMPHHTLAAPMPDGHDVATDLANMKGGVVDQALAGIDAAADPKPGLYPCWSVSIHGL